MNCEVLFVLHLSAVRSRQAGKETMAIRFVIGSVGSGKTEWMHQEMLRLSEEPGRSVYCIVPDQATLQAQKDLVAKQKNGCVMNIDILSFGRLKYRLAEELGDCFPPVLDDIGKNMLLKKVLVSADGKLQIYRGKHKKTGFLGELKSMISELQRYLVDAGRLKELSDSEEDPILRDKLSDLSVVLSDFRDLLGDRYLTEEDVYSAMCVPVERSVKLRGADLFLYGFTGFTPSQFLLLRSLMRVSGSMTIALSMDRNMIGDRNVYDSIFRMTQKTIDAVRKIADEERIPELPPVIFDNEESADALTFLKNNLFRRNGKHFDGNVSGVSVHSLPARADEIRFLLTEIERLVRFEGYRYREIAVICGDVQAYAQEIEEAAETSGIPCFIDYKSDLMNDPLVDLLRSIFRVFETDFRADAVTHYMKNVLSGYQFEDACLMENYLIAKGIRGASAYKKPFRYTYKTRHQSPLEAANRVREQIAADLIPLLTELKSADDVSASVRVLYEFLLRHGCAEKLNALADELETIPGRKAEARSYEYRKIYETVLSFLDQMNDLMGDMKLSMWELAEVMEAGFAELKLGRIPPDQDSVTVGDVKRSRLDGVRCLFLLGVNEGSLPGCSQGSGILSDKERELLAEKKVELGELPKESLPTEEFYIYLASAKPAERLYVSYHRTGDSGRESKPSYVIYRLMGLLPKLEICNEHTDRSLFGQIAADHAGKAYRNACSDEGEHTLFDEALKEWFASAEGEPYAPEEKEEMEKAKAGEPSPREIPAELARQLYGSRLSGGVTMMERYAGCAFRTFLERGLGLEDRQVYEADAADIGSFMHEALRRYSEEVKASGTTFRLISEEDAAKLMERTVDSLLAEEKNEIFQSDNRNAYTAYRIRELLLHMTKMIREQLKAGRFEPEEFEKKYSFSSEYMDLYGSIDRVDTCTEDGRKLIKVSDYKSSVKDLDYGEVYAGTKAQLPVYMKAVLRENPTENVPAAMLYACLDDPYVNADDEEKAEAARKDAIRPKGVILSDTKVLQAIDNKLTGEAKEKSDVVILSDDKMLSVDEMNALSDYAEQLLTKEAKEILSGNIIQNPVRGGQNPECFYCSYSDFCTKKIREEKNFRTIPKMSKADFFLKLEEDKGNGK